ncbi:MULTISPECIES: DUF305 domain-containing protein [Cryobacterium]|uniref:DUF305 domain-containing protein n=1 Tax=Cryobacterium TaxID=69578 RepID=UPI001F53F985|nr:MULTISPECIES: DUF305 domain-containing protein [Cryobacterium]
MPRIPGLPARVAVILAVVAIAAVVGIASFSLGRLSTLADAPPSGTSAEAGFARDMQVHHNQGVQLALVVRDRTDDPAVRLLAYDIAATQAQQSGQLFGWLTQWGLPQAGREPAMMWMTRAGRSGEEHGHSAAAGEGQAMPGLATDAQVAELTAASGTQAERIFLTLMIAHHQGAVEMAEGVLDRSDNGPVRSFAQAVVTSQNSEIELMTSMLAARA